MKMECLAVIILLTNRGHVAHNKNLIWIVESWARFRPVVVYFVALIVCGMWSMDEEEVSLVDGVFAFRVFVFEVDAMKVYEEYDEMVVNIGGNLLDEKGLEMEWI
ncbi:hypothetical protein Tco_0673363 [Tanacetum coccineum]